MKVKPTLVRFLILAGSSLLAVSSVKAADYYWDGGTGVWGTNTFWSTDPADINLDPVGSPISSDDVYFSSTSASTQSIAALNADRAALSLTFNTSFGTLLRAQSAAATARKLTIGSGGITVASTSGAVTINDTPATYGTLTTELSAAQAWANQSASLFTVGGPVVLGAHTLTLSGGGSGNTTLSGLISGTGAVTIDRTGSGGVTFGGANTFSGQLTVARGTLSVASINNVSSAGTLGNSALAVILGSSGGNTGTLNYTGTGSTASSTKPFTLATGGSGGVRVENSGTALTLSGLFSGSGNLVKTGPGTLILSNNSNNYSGRTVVNGGVLQIGTAFNAGELSVPGGYTSNPTTGSNIELNGGLLSYWFDFNRTLGTGAGQIQITGGTSGFIQRQGDRTNLTFNTASTLIDWGSANFNPTVLVLNDTGAANSITFNNLLNLNGASRTIATNNATHGAIMNNVISNSTGTAGLIKTGVGNLRLNAANTYNGATLISEGTLSIGNGGTTGSLSTSSVITTDATLAFNRTNTLTQGTDFANGILGSGGVTQAASGTTILSGTNSYTGNTRGNAGILLATVATALPGYDSAGKVIFNGGTIGVRIGGSNWTTTQVDTLLSNATKTSGALGIDTTNGSISQWTTFAGGAGNFGALGLTKLGSNALTLDQANTYTGPTRIAAGTLTAGIATVAGVSGALGVNSAVTLDNVAGVTLNLAGFNTQVASLAGGGTTGGNVTLGGATLTIGANNTNNVNFAGVISGNGNLVKTGTGVNTLSGSNTYNGTTTVNQGVLDFGAGSLGFGGGSGRNITVAAGAGVRRNTLDNTFLNRIVETSDQITVMTGTTSNNLDFSSSTGANLPNAFLGNWAGNGAKAEYSGTLTPASDNYRLGGTGSSGLLGIVGTNKLTGDRGLIVGGTTGSGIRVNIAGANNFTGNTVINASARLSIGNNLALQNSALDVGSAGGTFSLAAGTNAGRITGETAAPSPTFGGLIGSRNLISVFSTSASNNETNLAATAVTGFTLNVAADRNLVYTGNIGGFGTGASGSTGGALTLTKTGLGTQVLGGTNTYTGITTISNGMLQFGKQVSLYNNTGASWTASNIAIGNGGTLGLNVGGTGEFTTADVTTLLGNLGGANGTSTTGFAAGSRIAFDTTNAAGGSFTVADAIADSTGTGGGSIGVTKLGTGSLILTNASNTYSGPTTVSAGTLVVDGNISTSSLTTVKSGATLGGSGTVGDLLIESGGFFSPGNSPGVTIVDGDYVQNGGLNLEIDGLTAGNGAGFHDQVVVNGALTLSGSLNLTAFSGFTPANGDLIFILLNDSNDVVNGTFSGLAQGDVVGNHLGFDWQISYTGDSTGNSFTGGNDIVLMAVPEPRAVLLGGLGLLLILRRRR